MEDVMMRAAIQQLAGGTKGKGHQSSMEFF